MANSVQSLLHIAQAIEEILNQHLQRSTIKRLFNVNSDVHSLKKSLERLQNLLEVLRVASQVETRLSVDYIEGRPTSLQETLQMSSVSQHASSNSLGSHVALTTQAQVPASTGPIIGHCSISRSATTYIQDHSVVVEGSGNNITMIICDSRRSD